MRTFFFAAILLLLAATGYPAAADYRTTGLVVRVTDGDTLVLNTGRTSPKVRLFGIDAPETRHLAKAGQPFGTEAKRALGEKVLGRRITLEILDVDKNRRIVGIVRIGRRDINREMIEEGWAWAYRRYLTPPLAASYLGAEKDARRARRGLWQQEAPQAPWIFRLRQKLQ
ncbi:thermonuclease family protein [Geobacter sp.]|uniref:thermonuclease family protein n=1 Tax=Geobacter sp. TaxID=46610 RepID=UPI0026341579|nr:thermonuclease family protein [Geobacter sp.]